MIRFTFAVPAMLAALSIAGLIVALTGDGWQDLMSWAALSLPLFAVIWATARQPSRKDLP